MKRRILLEASGSLVSSWVIKAVAESGNTPIVSDITEECVGRFLSDEFVLMPSQKDPHLWEKLEKLLLSRKIDVVLPSLDETLPLWSNKKNYLKTKYGIEVIISPLKTIDIFIDKYKTYHFFKKWGIPTPLVSLNHIYPVIKPRLGRGAKGIQFNPLKGSVNMQGMISQELLTGDEYTVDCLLDTAGKPIYIIPRKRLLVKDGKSVSGIVVKHPKITAFVERICKHVRFFGPINLQCFETKSGIKFTEINPRIGGGMALGFAATENWIPSILDRFLKNKTVVRKKPILYGTKMYRYYEEIFIK